MKMKTINMKKIAFFAIVMLLISSCRNSLQNKEDTIPQDQDMGIIKVSATTKNTRSIMPAADDLKIENLTDITLTGKWQSGGGTPTEQTLIPATEGATWSSFQTKATLAVQTGEWDFTLSAQYNGVTFSGTVTETIVKNTTTTLSFVLESTVSYGGLSITINLTQGDASNVVATLKDSSGTTVDTQTLAFPVTEPPAFPLTTTYSIPIGNNTSTGGTLTNGDYKLELAFKSSDTSLPALNTWKGMVRIAKGITTTGSISWATDKVYSIEYNKPSDATFVDAVVPLTFTRKSSAISLPQVTRSGYYFEGWYTNPSYTAANKITEIPAGTTEPCPVYARFINTVYVKSGGASYAPNYSDGTRPNTGFARINDAITKIKNCNTSSVNWIIEVHGEIQFDDESEVVPSTLTTSHAASLTIQGGIDSFPTGIIDGGESVTALAIQTAVPVTIKEITIQNGDGEFSDYSGGGLFIDSAATVTVLSGTVFNSNSAPEGGAIYSKGTLILKGGTFTGNTATTTCCGNDIYLDKNSSDVQTKITIGGALASSCTPSIAVADCQDDFEILALASSPSPTTTIAAEYSKFTIENEGAEITNTGLIHMLPPVASVEGTPYYTQATAYNAILTATGAVSVVLGDSCDSSMLGNSSTANTLAYAIKNTNAAIALSVESGATISLAQDSTGLFEGCENLVSADLQGFDTSNVQIFDSMFKGCSNLSELDLYTFTNTSITSAISMFENCSSLVTIWATNDFKLSSKLDSTSGENIFTGCTSIKGGVGWLYNSDSYYVTNAYQFASLGGSSSTGYFTSKDANLIIYDTTGSSSYNIGTAGTEDSEVGTETNPLIFKPARTHSANGTEATIYGGINTIQVRRCHGSGNFSSQIVGDSTGMFSYRLEEVTVGTTYKNNAVIVSLNPNKTDDDIAPSGYTYILRVTDNVTSRVIDCYIKVEQSGVGTKSAPDSLHDIVFADGTAIPYDANLTLNRYQKEAAVAYIFYKGTDLNNSGTDERMLGVGFAKDGTLKWCTTSAQAAGKNITTINCTVDDNTFTGVRNGKNNLQLIGTWLDEKGYTNDTETAIDEYPAFKLAKNYRNNTNAHIAGTIYDDGEWYLPSIAEVYWMMKCINEINTVSWTWMMRTTFDSAANYWSSTQYDGSNAYAGRPSDQSCAWTSKSQYNVAYATAIHEF